MIKLCSEQELKEANWLDFLPLQCEYCSKLFLKLVHKIRNLNVKFCSNRCKTNSKIKQRFEMNCFQCNSTIIKSGQQIKINKTKTFFCSKSCSITYRNARKIKGYKRSKFEIWTETVLLTLFPNLTIEFNKTNAINSELDIYIPNLKLAFELNGIVHYEPIYGQEKFISIKNNDLKKVQACLSKQIELCVIELCVIDISIMKHFSKKESQKYLDFISSKIKSSGEKGTFSPDGAEND